MSHFLTKEQLVDAATKVQRSLCCYDGFMLTKPGQPEPNPPHTCDCKYGATQVGRGHEIGNGCPEMREVVGILSLMKDSELKKIQARALKRAKRA